MTIKCYRSYRTECHGIYIMLQKPRNTAVNKKWQDGFHDGSFYKIGAREHFDCEWHVHFLWHGSSKKPPKILSLLMAFVSMSSLSFPLWRSTITPHPEGEQSPSLFRSIRCCRLSCCWASLSARNDWNTQQNPHRPKKHIPLPQTILKMFVKIKNKYNKNI